MLKSITILHREIDARVADARAQQPDWPCAKGCAKCCRSLADVPQLTAAEWDLLKSGLAALPTDSLLAINEKICALAQQAPAPVTCPLLDAETDACPVYAQRPVACRTYGFYVQRDRGLYCGEIEAGVATGQFDGVVWGNHDAVDRQLASLGEKRPLTEWFAGWDPVRSIGSIR